MNKNLLNEIITKKIIAREFLVFLGTVMSALVFFLFIHLYAKSQETKLSNLFKTSYPKINTRDSLDKIEKSKLQRQVEFCSKYFKLNPFSEEEKYKVSIYFDKNGNLRKDTDGNLIAFLRFRELEENGQLETIMSKGQMASLWYIDYGLEDYFDLRKLLNGSFINGWDKQNRSKQIGLDIEIRNIENEILNVRQKILSKDEQIRHSLVFWGIMIFVLFILRYFIYATKWSINNYK